MKKSLKIITSLVMSLTLLFSVQSSVSAATCKPSNIGGTCPPNNIHSVQNVKVYYTKANVNTIVARYNALSSNKSLILAYIAGMKSGPVGLGILMYTIGSNNIIKPFQEAKKRKTGLEVSYTVTIYKSTNIVKTSNTKYKYR